MFSRKFIDALTLFVNDQCNLKCVYCFQAEKSKKPLLSLEEFKKLVKGSKKYGAKFVIIVGKEPLMYKEINSLLDYIHDLSIKPVLNTNGTLINKDLASYLYARNVDVHFNLDSLNRACYKKITKKEALKWTDFEYLSKEGKNIKKRIPIQLKYLLEAGFSDKNTVPSITLEVCATKINYHTIPVLAEFCRDNSIRLRVERLIKEGMAKKNYKMLVLSEAKHKKLFGMLADIIGKSFLNYNQQPLCPSRENLTVHEDGEVGICAVQRTCMIGNVKDKSLKQLIKKRKSISLSKAVIFSDNFKICAGRNCLNGY
jgi:MoaA/NifB/PqqE/SkfB family radical SAM enzyme